MNRTMLTYVSLFIGATVQGVAMSLFLFPHSIPSGGAAGLAILLNYFFHLPLGLGLWFSNAVFLIFALNYFGFTWTVKTILSVATTSTVVSFFSQSLIHPHIHISLDILFGGILFGIGVGLLIRVGSSSGGMVIPALMIANHRQWNPGKVMFAINLFIFLLTSIVIDYKIVFYAIICQFISSNIIDYIYELKLQQVKIFLTPSWRKK
ncbi:YitT family protein [Caldibacillus lycopersici]|uniref:YitT family protein n=1 Tax=Perspicuibacillus lycopersici TaxID=1325689 RepID=A0AAE3LRJ7_9BACI|nr:YitT family protein [Perspicuibacillus lycopersici]MCU9614739.1 YitT family protein [Perspicuibacillus lycopersici]